MSDIGFNEGTVSIGTDDGKTLVLKTGTLVTTAVTADQVVLTYTVTVAKTFFVEYVTLDGFLTSTPGNANPVKLGTISLETPSGTKAITADRFQSLGNTFVLPFSEPLPVAAGVVIRVVCTPFSASSMTWRAGFGGYER
jgi:hypothetical protein